MTKTFEDRPYQQRIITKVLSNWRKKLTSQMIIAPCGSGKTVMALSILKQMLNDSQTLYNCDQSKIGIAWVAMRKNLLTQVEEENTLMIQCPNLIPISMFDNKPQLKMNKFEKIIMVGDECHHDACESMHYIVNTLKPIHYLGLSATQFRTDRMKLCFQETIKDANYRELIEAGYLSRYNHWNIEDWNPQTVAKMYLENPIRWGPSLIFFRTFEECLECYSTLIEEGVKCEIVTGKTNRFQQLDKFEAGELDVLINMFILTEGFNYEPLKSVFVRDSNFAGPTIQMCGRVLRKYAPTPYKNIIQSVNTGYPFIRTAKPVAQYIRKEGEWKSLEQTKMIKIMEKKMLKRISETLVVLPQFLSKHKKKDKIIGKHSDF